MGQIISVHSFRGGTGKSNMTANLAVTIAARGHRVGVVDTDIQSPGIHVLFGLNEERMDRALNDYLWGHCGIEETAYDLTPTLKMEGGELAVVGGSIHLIPSSIKAGEIAKILREGYDASLLSDGFQDLLERLRLDYLFIDTHPGLNEETLLSIAISDVFVLILRPDQQDFQGTAVTVEVARKLGVPRMMTIVNKALPSLDLHALGQQVQETYGVPVAGVFPLTEEMVRLGSAGVFCLKYPDHPFSQQIRKVADQLCD